MERNRWDTAIRCLEVALHPHTSDDEVIAAVNGFRRTAGGVPLGDVCAAFAADEAAGGAAAADAARWRLNFERLQREHRALQARLDREENRRAEAERRADMAAHEVRALRDEVAALRDRPPPPAASAMQAGIVNYMDRPEAAPRRTFTPAPPAEPLAVRPKPLFQKILEAAQAEPWTA